MSYTAMPSTVFRAQCLIKHRGKFTSLPFYSMDKVVARFLTMIVYPVFRAECPMYIHHVEHGLHFPNNKNHSCVRCSKPVQKVQGVYKTALPPLARR
jgi:hypothetical protein